MRVRWYHAPAHLSRSASPAAAATRATAAQECSSSILLIELGARLGERLSRRNSRVLTTMAIVHERGVPGREKTSRSVGGQEMAADRRRTRPSERFLSFDWPPHRQLSTLRMATRCRPRPTAKPRRDGIARPANAARHDRGLDGEVRRDMRDTRPDLRCRPLPNASEVKAPTRL